MVDRHLDHLRWRHLRSSTITQRRNALRRLRRATATDPIDCTAEQIVAWLSRHENANTKAAEMAHLRGFFKWAVREGLRVDNPMERIDRPRVPRSIPHPIPESDLAMALEMAPVDRIKPWLHLAAYAGLRACEIAPIRGEAVRWEADPPILIVEEGKGGDAGAVPLAPVLEPILRALPHRGLLFPRRDGRPGPLPAWNVSHQCNRYLHSIGIPDTLHRLRHRFGTMTYRASGYDLRETQELMRHRTSRSTEGYTALVPGKGARTVAALPVFT